MVNYSESTFGGVLTTAADYQDPYVIGRINDSGWAIWAPIRFSNNTINFATDVPFPSPPSRTNLLGTDSTGGDVLAKVIYGFRISLLFGLTLTLFSSVIGICAGAVQGYYGAGLISGANALLRYGLVCQPCFSDFTVEHCAAQFLVAACYHRYFFWLDGVGGCRAR